MSLPGDSFTEKYVGKIVADQNEILKQVFSNLKEDETKTSKNLCHSSDTHSSVGSQRGNENIFLVREINRAMLGKEQDQVLVA